MQKEKTKGEEKTQALTPPVVLVKAKLCYLIYFSE